MFYCGLACVNYCGHMLMGVLPLDEIRKVGFLFHFMHFQDLTRLFLSHLLPFPPLLWFRAGFYRSVGVLLVIHGNWDFTQRAVLHSVTALVVTATGDGQLEYLT